VRGLLQHAQPETSNHIPRQARRAACVQAVAALAAGRAAGGLEDSSSDVLKVAEAFEAWVIQRASEA
jgi:hypothetical protein